MADTLDFKRSSVARRAPEAPRRRHPERLGRWELAALEAEGATSRIYRARPEDAAGDAPGAYALKLLGEPYASQPRAIEQFHREAIVGGTLNHPNLVPVLAAHAEGPPYYLVMPLLAGATLSQRLAAAAYPALPVALWIVRQVAEALAELQAAGWMHCDVKPANIFVSPLGHATLIDLGTLGRLDEAQSRAARCVAGTLLYAAPETMTSALRRDIRSDIYSLGVTLFELLAGHAPFAADDPAGLIALHRQGKPPELKRLVPHLPREVFRLVKRMIAKDPWRRPQSPNELVNELTALEITTFGDRLPLLPAESPADGEPGDYNRLDRPTREPLPAAHDSDAFVS